jgi:chorismate lyase/3-hydroxybenzoate synthase
MPPKAKRFLCVFFTLIIDMVKVLNQNLPRMNDQVAENTNALLDLLPGRYTHFNSGHISGLESEDIIIGECHVEQFLKLEDQIEKAYLDVIEFVTLRGKGHIWRCWNRIPRINAQERGTERYKLFCTGRHRALLGTENLEKTDLPAATAVGTDDPFITIKFVAANSKGRSIENPNQISAYNYPRQYGKDSPSFARAYLACGTLFISGTASIRGHQSLHENDLHGQLKESQQRIEELLQDHEVKMLTAYVRDIKDMPTVDKILRKSYPNLGKFQIDKADICRRELLVEIEAIAT